MGYGLLASGCAPVTPVVPAVTRSAEIDSLEKAEQAWRAETVAEHQPIWKEESGPDGDPFAAGLAAYHLASATFDPAWSNQAIGAFDRVLGANPGSVLARAWRGSAHALLARDYPVRGLWQIVPGPGFVRLYHVKEAFTDLDSAVGAAPHDPLVRLIRASTYLAMPSVFGGEDEALADFDKLHAWTRDPDRNRGYADILRTRSWREEYFLARSRAMGEAGRNAEAGPFLAAAFPGNRQPHPEGPGEVAPDIARRIAITGAGAVGSFGIGTGALWAALGAGERTFPPCTRYQGTLPCAEAVKPDLRRMLQSGQTSRMSLVSQFAIAAVHLALTQARLPAGKGSAGPVVGIVYGTSHGPAATTQGIYDDLIDHGAASVKPRAFQESVFNAPASLASIQFGLKGPNPGAGRECLRAGRAPTGADAAGALRCRRGGRAVRGRAVRGRPVRVARPAMAPVGGRDGRAIVGAPRRGAISSEGAAALLLERADRAMARSAPALAEMAGAVTTNDAWKLVRPAPDARGLIAAVRGCFADAEATPDDVDVILSALSNNDVDDALQAAAVQSVFGDTGPPVASMTDDIGHAMGAAECSTSPWRRR